MEQNYYYNLVDNFLSYNNINKIKGAPNNPHSQGVVKRLHQTLKDLLCCIYIENTENFDLKESLEIALKKYNNHIHTSTKYKPNYAFYSNSNELFDLVLKNIKNSFKSLGKNFKNSK